MKTFCQLILLVQCFMFCWNSFRNALRRLAPDKPSGCLWLVWATLVTILGPLLFWKAGAFTALFPWLYR